MKPERLAELRKLADQAPITDETAPLIDAVNELADEAERLRAKYMELVYKVSGG